MSTNITKAFGVISKSRDESELLVDLFKDEYKAYMYKNISDIFENEQIKSLDFMCIDSSAFTELENINEKMDTLFKISQELTLPIIVFSKDRTRELEWEMLRKGAFDFLLFPINTKSLKTRIEKALKYREHELFLKNIVRIRSFEIERLQVNFVKLLNIIGENKGPESESHLTRLQNYCVAIGKELRQNKKYKNIVSDKFLKYLYALAPMHDVGALILPEEIVLNYASGKLRPSEIEIMKSHTTKGGHIVEQISEGIEDNFFLEIAFDLAQSHHEYWSGCGYPDGLKGDEIPLAAQLLRIAEEYNTLVQKGAYRSAENTRIIKTHQEAVEFIALQKNKLFSEDIVNAFLAVENIIEKIAQKF